ncbi:MAG: hypothetical protein ACRDKI_02870 [Solirubrobacterales bacterium]
MNSSRKSSRSYFSVFAAIFAVLVSAALFVLSAAVAGAVPA